MKNLPINSRQSTDAMNVQFAIWKYAKSLPTFSTHSRRSVGGYHRLLDGESAKSKTYWRCKSERRRAAGLPDSERRSTEPRLLMREAVWWEQWIKMNEGWFLLNIRHTYHYGWYNPVEIISTVGMETIQLRHEIIISGIYHLFGHDNQLLMLAWTSTWYRSSNW